MIIMPEIEYMYISMAIWIDEYLYIVCMSFVEQERGRKAWGETRKKKETRQNKLSQPLKNSNSIRSLPTP
jgi:hypothetical protein